MNRYIFDKSKNTLDLHKEVPGNVFGLYLDGEDFEVAVIKSLTCKGCVFSGGPKTCRICAGAYCSAKGVKYVKIAEERTKTEFKFDIKQVEPLWIILGRLDGAISMMEKEVLNELQEGIVSSLKETRSRLEKFVNENLSYEDK